MPSAGRSGNRHATNRRDRATKHGEQGAEGATRASKLGQASFAGGLGCVGIPRNPAKDTPKLHYILSATREAAIRQGAATAQDASAVPARTADQPPLTQAVGAALVSVLNGKIEKVELDTASIDPALFEIVKD